ncbi:hypothetical protein P59_096 [Bacillus phage P59]|nr:hypothetical protein P59_096 [Bacillus phage P59]
MIMSGDVIFYRPEGPVGWIISKVSRSPYSHVSLAIDSNTVIEADRFVKSRFADLTYNKEIHHVYRLRDVTEAQRQKIVEVASTFTGVGYNYSKIVSLFLRLVFNVTKSPFNNANKLICSDIIDKAFIMAKVPRADTNNMMNLTPQELLSEYDLVRVL